VANRQQDIELVRNKVTALLAIEDSR